MHDTVRKAKNEQVGSIDPDALSRLEQGDVTIEHLLENERIRLKREHGIDNRSHARAIQEHPFTRSEREHTTVLFGGLTWKHERLIQASLRQQGYNAESLPTPDIQAFHIGKEFGNNGLCNPTYFTVGSLVKYLQDIEKNGLSRRQIIDSYILFTAGACGPCRFGMYEAEYRRALKNAGFDGFRVLILEQTGGLNQGVDNAGLEMNLDFTLGIVNAFLVGDLLNDLAFQIRPYEIEEGATDRALKESIDLVAEKMEAMESVQLPSWLGTGKAADSWKTYRLFFRQLFGSRLTGVMDECRRVFSTIAVYRSRLCPVVKITGEFWAQTTEGDGNFNMFRFLEDEGAEVMIEPITPWLLYMLHQEKQARRDRRYLDNPQNMNLFRKGLAFFRAQKSWLSVYGILTLSERLLIREYNKLRKRMGNIPQALPDQRVLQKVAHRYYNTRIEGGEGHLEVAKNIYYTENRLSHMVLSLKPFGCMPSTQSDGVQSAVTHHYPDSLYLPVETSGEGEVNAHSRVQMTLNEARSNARKELELAFSENGFSTDSFKKMLHRRPELRDPFFATPPDGRYCGRSARIAALFSATGSKAGA